MAVKYPQGGGGGGFNPLGLLSTLAMLIPGAQVAAPWLQLANAGVNAANGNWAGAAMSGVGALTGGADGGSIFSSSATPEIPSIEPTMGIEDVRKSLSDLNPTAQPLDAPAVDITANQRMLNGTEAMLPWSDADETKYQGLLGQYGLSGKQAVGGNADMGTRFADNNIAKQPRSDADYQNRFNELLAQYDLSDMDWTKRRQRNGLMGGL